MRHSLMVDMLLLLLLDSPLLSNSVEALGAPFALSIVLSRCFWSGSSPDRISSCSSLDDDSELIEGDEVELNEAVEDDLLHKSELGEINAYTPNLSAAWMFQKAMSVRMKQNVDPKFVNRLLAVNFDQMDDMGERTIMPFLQDVVRIDGLAGSLARSFAADPTFMPQIVAHVGIPTLAEWLGHVSMIAAYTVLFNMSSVIQPFVDRMKDPRERFVWRRRMEAWKFGSGNDYIFDDE